MSRSERKFKFKLPALPFKRHNQRIGTFKLVVFTTLVLVTLQMLTNRLSTHFIVISSLLELQGYRAWTSVNELFKGESRASVHNTSESHDLIPPACPNNVSSPPVWFINGSLTPDYLRTFGVILKADKLVSQCDIHNKTYCQRYFLPSKHKVNTFRYRVIRTASGYCPDVTDTVVLVQSYFRHFEKRETLRDTWVASVRNKIWPNGKASPSANSTRWLNMSSNIIVRFVLGSTNSSTREHARFLNETAVHRDIIQGDFTDTYENLTLKHLLALKWVSEYCPCARFVIKCDDDTFLNIPALLNTLPSVRDWSVIGALLPMSPVIRGGKWKVEFADYPFRYYPPYLSGHAYIMTSDVSRPMLQTSERVPLVPVDDAYITGILTKMLAVNVVKDSGFDQSYLHPEPNACSILQNKQTTAGNLSPSQIRRVWSGLLNSVC